MVFCEPNLAVKLYKPVFRRQYYSIAGFVCKSKMYTCFGGKLIGIKSNTVTQADTLYEFMKLYFRTSDERTHWILHLLVIILMKCSYFMSLGALKIDISVLRSRLSSITSSTSNIDAQF